MRNVIRHDRGLNQRENTTAGHRVHWSSRGRNGRGNSGFGVSFIHCLSTCVRPHLGSSHRMPSSVCCVYRKYLSDYQTINEWYEAFKLSTRDEVLQRPDIRKTGVHPNFWYPVARSDNVKTGKPHPVSFAGELGHLLTMARAKSGERYLLGRINRWLCDFLKRVEPHARYRTPRFYAPHWLRFLNACASETCFGRTGLRLCRTKPCRCRAVHTFPVMQSGKRTRLSSASSIDPAIHDAVENFVAAASRQLSPADFPSRGRGDDFLEPRIATERIPKW